MISLLHRESKKVWKSLITANGRQQSKKKSGTSLYNTKNNKTKLCHDFIKYLTHFRNSFTITLFTISSKTGRYTTLRNINAWKLAKVINQWNLSYHFVADKWHWTNIFLVSCWIQSVLKTLTKPDDAICRNLSEAIPESQAEEWASENFWKSINIWWSCDKNFWRTFLTHEVVAMSNMVFFKLESVSSDCVSTHFQFNLVQQRRGTKVSSAL